jgi:glycosyltransferase involved in cell wall biosynthesis
VFKGWTIIDPGLRKSNFGHQYSETRALAGEVLGRGGKVRVVCFRDAPEPWFPGLEIVPALSLFAYQPVSDDRAWGALENFIVHNRVFDQDLSRLDRAALADTLCLFATMDVWHIMGALRWLGRFEGRARPSVAINLFPLKYWSPEDFHARLLQTAWKECPPAVKASVRLCVRETESVGRFERLLGEKPHFLPSPLGPIGSRSAPAHKASDANAPMQVAFVGGARPERGAGLIPDIVAQCASPEIPFFVQVKGETTPSAAARLRALRGTPHVHVHEGVLDENAYYGVIAKSLVLLPYRPDDYGIKSSGVYVEAKFMGSPVIVPEGSWMADDVRALGNGLVFDAFNAESVADCIRRAQREIVRLRAAARDAAIAFRAANGADRCVDATEALFANVAQDAAMAP